MFTIVHRTASVVPSSLILSAIKLLQMYSVNKAWASSLVCPCVIKFSLQWRLSHNNFTRLSLFFQFFNREQESLGTRLLCHLVIQFLMCWTTYYLYTQNPQFNSLVLGYLVTKFLTLLWWWGSAPAASNFSTTLSCPLIDAHMRAVAPFCGRRRKTNKR